LRREQTKKEKAIKSALYADYEEHGPHLRQCPLRLGLVPLLTPLLVVSRVVVQDRLDNKITNNLRKAG
jgi:hypothetical protein